MNKAETEAQRLYRINKAMAETGLLNIDELCKKAKDQDKLYKVIHNRADAKYSKDKP